MKTVLFDTNFLLLPGAQGIDIFSEIKKLVTAKHELATLSSVVGELVELSKSASKTGSAAKVALELIRQRRVRVYETTLKPDPSIVDFAERHAGVVVCTNDRDIKKQLKLKRVEVIGPKGMNYLTFI